MLLEVIIALTILTVTVGAVMRSFTQSMAATRMLEVETQASFFAQQLLDEFEINPPEEGVHEGGFGEAYAPYYYQVEVEYVSPDYEETIKREEVEQFVPLRLVTIDIYYDDGTLKPMHPVRELRSAIMGFERFSEGLKRELHLY